MEDAIPQEDIKEFYLYFLEETFAAYRGIYLEEGSSLTETLNGITSEQASIRVGGKCGSLAA